MQWRLILTLAIMVVVVVFSLANAEPVPFNYLLSGSRLSLALIIIVSALVGAIAGVVAGLSAQIRLRHELHEKERQLRGLVRDKAELSNDVEADRLNRRPRDRREPE